MLEPSRQTEIIEQISQRITMVVDPEMGRSVVEMGLIYLVEVGAAGNAHIVMTTTTRGCPASAFLTDAVHTCAASVPGVESVEVELSYDPLWDPSMMAS